MVFKKSQHIYKSANASMSSDKDGKCTGVLADPTIVEKVDALIATMTIDEKIGQTVMYSTEMDVTGPVLDKDYQNYVRNGQVGAICNAVGTKFIKKLQKIAVEETRLGIPMLFGYDVIHGYKTIFPIPLAESCSWDLELIEKTAKVAALEASAAGIHWVFAPMVDIARDPRWGRISEGAGEDTFLATLIAKARVKGFQGSLNNHENVLACVKHFAAYGALQGGREYHTVDMSEVMLRNVYLPPFKEAVHDGVATVMSAFNDLNGIPLTANPYMLTDILRKEWGFDGFVITDYTSINELVQHGYATDLKHAGELSMNAGADMDLQGGVYKNYLKQSIEDGIVPLERLNHAVKKILGLKFKLGLMDDPYKYCDIEREQNNILKSEHLELAELAAKKSMVLLKNENDILPLNESQKIALIGPLADDCFHILGNWVAQGHHGTESVISSVKDVFTERNVDFNYAKGCDIDSNETSLFEAALNVVQTADVVVMVMGEAEHMSGEAASRSNIKLPGKQQALISKIIETGRPIVLVLMNGRPLDLSFEHENVQAILEAWYPGTRGAQAVTDTLFGNFNPSGKLTVSFPRNVGQIPVFYNQKNTGRPITNTEVDPRFTSKYLDVSNTPLYPFGYGLSYTTFKYHNMALDVNELTADSSIKASINITNTGKRDGQEIVQLYIRDVLGSITRPIIELKGFQKVFLKTGETKTVSFVITADDLRFFNHKNEYLCETGVFEVNISKDAAQPLTHKFFLNI